jgi:UDP-GlcNAc3NAcA epimerase
MITIVTIIGARPQIIKAAALSRAIRKKYSDRIREVIIHTGQHYDENMSGVFFSELGIPHPDHNLNTGSGTHGKQTAAMISGIEEVLMRESPDAIVLYGDTNSTLAGAIAASKLHVPVVHIEAGLRSFNKSMPEEINRILCDHVSTLLFTPTSTGLRNLVNEGFSTSRRPPFNADNPGIFHCGDVMYDNSLFFSAAADERTGILKKLGLEKGKFILATIHRNNNTDEPQRLSALFRSLNNISLSFEIDVVLPLHPRTSNLLDSNLDPQLLQSVRSNKRFHITGPASFLEMIALEKNCRLVMTDSGGVQKEAFYFGKPCIILRRETEWVELVECGAAIIADADEERIGNAYKKLISAEKQEYPSFYGDGNAAEFICEKMLETFETVRTSDN